MITGDLTINTPGAHVTGAISTSVGGSTNVTAVSNTSFVSQATHTGGIVVTDSDGATIDLSGNAAGANVTLNTAGPVTLKGSYTGTVTISDAATVEIASGASVSNLVVDAVGVKVNNTGIVSKVTANQDVSVVGTKPVATEGTGTVTEAANDEQLTEIQSGKRLVGVAAGIENGTTQDTLGYLTNRAVRAGNTDQVEVTYENLIKLFTLDVSAINTAGIKGHRFDKSEVAIKDLEVEVPTELGGLVLGLVVEGDDLVLNSNTEMSKTLFNAIKEQADAKEGVPYKITITKGTKDKTVIAKIAFEIVDGKIIAKLESK
ncbi:hypothetical protein [Sporosarcina gallistercoris]|uniref:Uncharacterized protein n=1 Tax=Sporosarcina gallistercoris TaxID=2762245 RepID=A0ABR8PFP5_9BACL|nr:hypothetical protein [Sporosarcina gallistercoris]MBD7906994.1 hypothetical protein [Sporosarcina gallistercoris]